MTNSSNIELGNLEIYKEIVEHLTESLWIGDNKNNTIYINSIFCDVTGYNGNEIIGKNYSVFMGEESIINIRRNPKNKKNNKTIKYETKIKKKNGETIPVLCSGTFTQNGGTVLTISDLSEVESLKQAELNLRNLNKTKDEFISIVGHELRTPLTSIRGYLSMILDGDFGKINDDIKKSLNHTYDSSVRLINLVNDVLSIGRIESGKMEYNIKNIKIIEIIESIHRDIDLEMKTKEIIFYIKLDKKLENSYINTDKDKLKQVFLNLLTNSIKFTKPKGKITLNVTKIKNKVKFEVIDTGIGIPEDKIDILFNKFSQVESSMQRQNDTGLGLGLAICKNFINKLGSDIKVESKVGKGSNFYFELELVG